MPDRLMLLNTERPPPPLATSVSHVYLGRDSTALDPSSRQMHKRQYRIGTRGSALALWQANWVAQALRDAGHEVVVTKITTSGDQSQTSPLRGFGGVGVFVKELEHALMSEAIDLAVHSLKDLPTERVPGLQLAAVPERASVCDVLIANKAQSLDGLSAGAVIGTGSARRRAFLMHRRRDLRMAEVRGNVDTRLNKVASGEYDAIILAAAGLERLGWTDRITEQLDLEWMLPAVGQGALGIEARADDAQTLGIVRSLNHAESHAGVKAERALLAGLRAGCLAPVGAWARTDGGKLRMNAAVAAPDGSRRIDVSSDGHLESPEKLGQLLAEELLQQGADEIIAAARENA